MAAATWDPLLTSKEVDTEIISAAQKRQISNILKSYVGMYDSFSELIQNAMDAVERRRVDLTEPDYKPKLWLTIDLKENSFSITDNGVGFKEQEFRSFLAPNISFKDGVKTRGNKGVGATYIAYGFDYLQFGTKGNGHEFVGEIVGGRDWVEDHQGIVTRPMVVPTATTDESFLQIPRGSTFKIRYGGKSVRPKDLSWYGAVTPDQWLYLLLIKTPLGAISYLSDSSETIQFSLTVIDKAGKASSVSDVDAHYIFPHSKISASVNVREVLALQQKMIGEGKDPSKLPGKYSKLHGVYEFFNAAEIQTLRNLEEHEKQLVKDYQVEAYGYFVYSTSVWDHLNDVTAMHFTKEHSSAPKVLEYKYSIDGLIAEFENGEKKEKDIHLAIAWELGTAWKKNYDATSLLDVDQIHRRDFHGLTHILQSSTSSFQVIALKELVDYLNDVDGVQDYHKKTYSEQ